MSGTAPKLDREFWRPPPSAAPLRVDMCGRCSSEFVVGSRFCHVCGAARDPGVPEISAGLARYLDFHFLQEALGLNAAALVALILGLGCAGFAAATGLVYAAATFADWQAVQAWRMEWLLASAAAFLAGILLKR